MSRLAVLAPVRVMSFSAERRPVAPPVPVPDAGAVWGAASNFDHALQPSDTAAEIAGGGSEVRWPSGTRTIRGVEQFREVSLATVLLGGDAVEVEGIRSITFHTGTREIRHEERKVKGAYTSIQPTIEHRKEFLRLVFPFAAALERGAPPPPDTPPLPDPDEHHGG